MERFQAIGEPTQREEDFSGYREVLTGIETGIPSLAILGHAADHRPILPIIDHQHRNKFEVILVFRGIRRVTAGSLDYTLYSGQAFIACPNETHASLTQQPSPAEILWFQLDISERNSLLGLSPWESQVLHSHLERLQARLLALPGGLLRRFSTVFELLRTGNELDRVEAHGLFVSSLTRLLRCEAPLERLTPEIDTAKQYIFLHIKELIDPDELLLTSGLSMKEFRARFEAQIGCSPREYIIRQKIERARLTLLRTNKTIVDIAYEYHFSSASFFKMQFRREIGMSPQKYRRKHKKDSPA